MSKILNPLRRYVSLAEYELHSALFEKLMLVEKYGILDTDNVLLDNLLKEKSKELFEYILTLKYDKTKNIAIIKNTNVFNNIVFNYFEITFKKYIDNYWIDKLYVLCTCDIYDKNNSLTLDSSHNSPNNISFDNNTKISPIKINGNNLEYATIILNYNENKGISEKIIYEILKHELKHIFKRLKTNYYNDNLYKDQIYGVNHADLIYNNYITFDKYGNPSLKNDAMEQILYAKDDIWLKSILKYYAYDLNDVEIQAKLENFNIKLNNCSIEYLEALNKINNNIIEKICIISYEAEHYYYLYKLLNDIIKICKDNDINMDYNSCTINKLKNIYNKTFKNAYELLEYLANERIYRLFLRHACTLFNEKISEIQ